MRKGWILGIEENVWDGKNNKIWMGGEFDENAALGMYILWKKNSNEQTSTSRRLCKKRQE